MFKIRFLVFHSHTKLVRSSFVLRVICSQVKFSNKYAFENCCRHIQSIFESVSHSILIHITPQIIAHICCCDCGCSRPEMCMMIITVDYIIFHSHIFIMKATQFCFLDFVANTCCGFWYVIRLPYAHIYTAIFYDLSSDTPRSDWKWDEEGEIEQRNTQQKHYHHFGGSDNSGLFVRLSCLLTAKTLDRNAWNNGRGQIPRNRPLEHLNAEIDIDDFWVCDVNLSAIRCSKFHFILIWIVMWTEA